MPLERYSSLVLTSATKLRYYRSMKEYTEGVIAILKVNGLRLTKTRKALVEVFLLDKTPLSVRDILYELQKVRIMVNKTTVYRELEKLQTRGIIDVVRLKDRKQYYELASREHHHHLICLSCERVEDVDMDEAKLLAEEETVNRERGFIVLRHSLEFFGLCKGCQLI